MTRNFTGWHMFAILFAMFGTIVAVNFVMARAAIRTFGGTVVDNSYVASQHYNRYLAEARAQRALGWTATASLDAQRHVVLATNVPAGTAASATIHHPLGRAPDQALAFTRRGAGFVSTTPLPAGRWQLRIELRDGAHSARFEDALK
ncbi:FixH family protein [Sphingomonas sp. LM7]|uniref:FixH family protein n=1 Tax=Sphingomonas sp. LM7 TaxID=1938607 RepID=UPI000983FF9F|nr:FixH family protein [Sphingomonas sp. LM7]AQR72636.1 hypothetical protein BXU08_02200 [Sphingomonas sp. LM7]